MDLRKEIESLAIWFILASIIIFLINAVVTVSGTGNFNTIIEASSDPSSLLIFFSSFGVFITLIDNLAIGIWLFRRTTLCGYNRWLWAMFGFTGSLIGGALYLFARVYESKPSNKVL